MATTANYVLINEQTLNASASSVTFSSIPQTGYTDLVVKFSGRVNDGNDWGYILFNSSSSNWSAKRLYGTGSSALSQSRTDNIISGIFDTTNETANTFNNVEIYIPNYTSANYKSVSIDGVFENNGTSAQAQMSAYLWSDTSAITSITIDPYGSFVAGSSFSLYGIAAVGTTPTVVPKASGGDVITNDGTYWIHQFYSSGTFIPNQNLSCEYLVIAGGGSGGPHNGGGGGAGGYTTASGYSVTGSTQYTVAIGAGGASKNIPSVQGATGSNSTFGAITASGGGGGGSYGVSTKNGLSGGSGGGASMDGTVAGTGGSATQGYAGGNGFNSGYSGGGGGGAGAVGQTMSGGNAGGAGGNGLASSISGTSTTYAGGGGGGDGDGSGGAGGTGGGGAGSGASGNATNGTVNLGAGGGGAGYAYSGQGGSGIVIIRYAMA